MEDIAYCTHISNRRDPSQTRGTPIPLWKPYIFNWRTKEEMLVCLKYWLHSRSQRQTPHSPRHGGETHARTLENSDVGDMTKLSFELDHEMRC